MTDEQHPIDAERSPDPVTGHPTTEPGELEASLSGEPPSATDVTDETVSVRRAPRYGRFLLAGGVVGALVALILTFGFPENGEFDRGQVFGFLLLALGTIGITVGAVVALVLDRVFARRRGSAIAQHESTHPIDD